MLFKCKMCGGELEITSGLTVAECEYCGTKQTLSKSSDEVVTNLFARANNLRLKCEFDKAEQVYEKILDIDNTDSEAHWGIVLCKYGIEYVEDPKTYKRVPTCHRTLYEAITTDANYISAIENADSAQKVIYEQEAKAIGEIQKDILSIVNGEKPFDVFICYKETDEDGKRTPDSVIANDIYYQLTQEGFKVFYAAITLEDKLGREYEPYIFAALNSAKVMLVVGTKPQYFDAVWVRNEWSRFLKLTKIDRQKLLIPCYRDMDAYELPDAFSHLQAQDMSKIGFINDVVRGIKKLVNKQEEKPTQTKEDATVTTASNVAPLLKRAFMFLEDGDWNSANEYCEKVLDIDPENAQAYLGKLMAELRVKKQEQLADCKQPFEQNINYHKVMRFGNKELAQWIKECCEGIVKRNEQNRLEAIYTEACNIKNSANNSFMYDNAAKKFKSIIDYKDSAALYNECIEQAEVCHKNVIYNKAKDAVNTGSILQIHTAIDSFKEIIDWRDSKEQIEICKEKINDIIYNNAKNVMLKNSISEYNAAIDLFEKIVDWRDSKKQIEICKESIEEIKLQEQRAEEERIKTAEIKKKKKKKITVIVSSAVSVIIAFVIVLTTVIIPSVKYNNAVALMNEGKDFEAMSILVTLGDFKDTQKHIEAFWDKVIVSETISTGTSYTVGLKKDGTVVSVGRNSYGLYGVGDWTDIVAINAGGSHIVGLKNDGTVVAVGNNANGECGVDGWTDIVAVSASVSHTVGIKKDGTVVAVGSNSNGQCDVSDWTDIVAVSAGFCHTVGLKIDGTVVAVGSNSSSQCDVSDWTDIVAVSAGVSHTVGLKNDGTVVAVGSNSSSQCGVDGWTDIVAVSAGDFHTVGLKKDGTVVVAGSTLEGHSDVSDWTDIVAVSAGDFHTVGLKKDGTVVAVGSNSSGQCDVGEFENIKTP